MPNVERHPDDPQKLLIDANDRETYLCQMIPGSRWDPQVRKFTAPISWGTWMALNGIFGQDGMVIGDRFAEWTIEEFNIRVRPSLYLRNKIDDNGVSGPYTDALNRWEMGR